MPTSTGRYVEMLVRNLEKVDSAHEYLVLMYPDKMDKWQPTNPNFTAVPCPYKEYTFAEQIGFKKQLEELHPDLVHFSMVQQPIRYHGKTVTTMQDLTTIRFRNPAKNWLIFTCKRWAYIYVNKRVAHKADALITPSDFVRQDVAQYTHISADKITVTHEAADDFDEAPAEMPFFANKTFVMADGRPRPHKNLRRVIEAFAILHQQYPDLYLMLTGKRDNSYEPYDELVHSLGLQDYVVQTDFIPDGQLKWAMQNTVAYIWPSLSEGFGLPPLEAMLQGAPVASSNASCMPEILGEAAHYFDPNNSNDLAQAVAELVDSPELRKTLIQRGKQRVASYSWQRMAEQTLAVYKKVLGEA